MAALLSQFHHIFDNMRYSSCPSEGKKYMFSNWEKLLCG